MTKRPTTTRPLGGSPGGEARSPLLAFNGIDATTGEYLLPAMDVSRLARVATGGQVEGKELAGKEDKEREGEELEELRKKTVRSRQANYAVVEGVDANDLAQTGWAAIFPATADPDAAARQAAIRKALAPLLTHRRAQATARADLYREYTGELGYQPGESKQQFLGRLKAGPGPVDPTKVPYYLLLVATPEEIPYRIQYQLDVNYAVGRIAFDTIEEYARYARGVVDAETGRAARPRRAAFFGVANPDDAATQLSADHLVLPLAEHVEGRHTSRGWTVDSYLADAATRARLVEILRDAPALLFTASHGMGYPSGNPAQRERQGALLCQDWAGPGKPCTREHYFTAEDLPAGADLRGMIAMLFACYGGGTPTRDEFTQRTLGEAKAKELAPAPLIARLPQRMLGHPGGGALAVVAHVDRAWGASFLWIDPKGKVQTMKHLDVFESMFDALLAGKRLGYAMEAFNLRYAELAADLSERLDHIQLYQDPYDDSEIAHLWVYNNDARNLVVLGDPAVRLVSDGEPAPAAPTADPEAPAAPTADPEAPAASRGAEPAPAPREPEETAPPSFGLFGKAKDAKDAKDDDKQPGLFARVGNKLGEILGDVVGDAAVLEVKTYTGDDLEAVAGGQPLSASGARLRAYTRCELDGDVDSCIPVTAAGDVDEKLWAVHAEMVKQAQAHRAELLKLLLSLFSPNVKG